MGVQRLPGERQVGLAECLVLGGVRVHQGRDVLRVRLPVVDQLGLADELADPVSHEVDTDHRRLEEARLLRADNTSIPAVNIENPPVVTQAPSSSFGFGIGGVSGGGGGGGGVGTGMSIGGPVGSPTTTIEGHTFISFPLAQSGPAPWRLQLRFAGTEPVVFVIGGP